MGEVLSQSEIDALLSALKSGDVDVDAIKSEESTRKIRVYDFRRPNKFSKDQLNTIEVINENFCRLMTTSLSGTLRSRVMAKVASVDQVTYEEFIRSIPNPTILNVFSLYPLEGKGILEINPIIGFSIIDRLFGGPGLSSVKGRPLTEIERGVMERVSERILSLFHEAWISMIEMDAVLENIEINPHFTQIVSPLEMVVIITINVQLADTEGFMNICIPCIMLEPISDKLNTKFWFTSTSSSQEDKTVSIQKVVEKTSLPLTAVLGQTSISIQELLDLQMGDVIPLEQKKDNDLEVYVGGKLKYFAKPGTVGRNMGLRITNVNQEGSEENE